jgi:hypothetical protein
MDIFGHLMGTIDYLFIRKPLVIDYFAFVKPITKNIPEIVSGKESAVLCSVTIGI